jgi:CRISPR-associated protein Csy1
MKKIIEEFLLERKTDFLEKKIFQETREKRQKCNQFLESTDNSEVSKELLNKEKQKFDEALSKAKDKFQPEADLKYNIKNWFEKVFKEAKPYITTHPAKFTNPKISDVTNLLFYGVKKNSGYVKTGEVSLSSKVDASGNSATVGNIFELYLLLEKKLGNEDKFIKLFERDSPELISFTESIKINYTQFKEKCLEVFYGKAFQQITHESVKQVYFPLQANDQIYHLLSILTPSMLMFEVKNRIDRNRTPEKQKIRKLKIDNKFYPEGFDEVIGLTEIGFSHNEFTKMGNVSYLNVRNKGIAYLLSSLPPEIKKREVRLPSRDFFENSLWAKSFRTNFEFLDRLIRDKRDNVDIRDQISKTLTYIADQVLETVFKIRDFEEGWSNKENYKSLPLEQRIWLDEINHEQREQDENWLEEVLVGFTRWVIRTYEYLFKDTCKKMGDAEFERIKKIIKEAINLYPSKDCLIEHKKNKE